MADKKTLKINFHIYILKHVLDYKTNRQEDRWVNQNFNKNTVIRHL